MQKTLEIVPFSIIDTKGKDCFDGIGVLFEETLRLNLKNRGINIKNLIIPPKNESGYYTLSVIIKGTSMKKKLEITLNKEKPGIKFGIFFYDASNKEWNTTKTEGFMPVDEFDKKFPTIMDSLT